MFSRGKVHRLPHNLLESIKITEKLHILLVFAAYFVVLDFLKVKSSRLMKSE